MLKRTRRGIGCLATLVLLFILAAYFQRGGSVEQLPQEAARVLDDGKRFLTEGKDRLVQTPEQTRDPASHPQAQQTAPAEAPNEPSSDAEAIQVFFAPCSPLDPFGIEAHFVSFLKKAKTSIFCAFYELQLPAAAETLIEQHRKGVKVGIVSDSDHKDRPAIQDCIRAGIPVVFDEREAIMHDKFCIVDGAEVWTGSTNITENCMFRNNNNSIAIESPQLAADFAAEFTEMFEKRKFGPRSPRETPYPEATVRGVRVECYFAPEDHVRQAIIQEIGAATTSIDFMAFSFTSSEIAEAIAARHERGVKVRGLFEERNAAAESSQDDYLVKHGCTIYIDKNEYSMHHKVIILDANTVVTGSYNFSNSAETRNDENVLILHSPEIAATYEKEFERIAGP